MIDRDKLAREAIDLNKQIAKLEVRSRKLTNALRCKDDEVAELYLRDDVGSMRTYVPGIMVLREFNDGKIYVLKADEIFGKGRIELIKTFNYLKEFEDYQEQMYEKYVNKKK